MADPIVEKELAQDTTSGTIARLANDKKAWKAKAATWATERNAARTENAQLKLDLAEAKKANGAVAELAELKATVKLEKHRGEFNRQAKEAGVKEKALDDLWNASGYKSEADTPDVKAIAKAIAAQKEAREYLFDDVAAEGTPEDGTPEVEIEAPKPGPGRGQGGTRKSTGGQFQATEAQLRNPEWCRANAGKLAAMAAEIGELTSVESASKFTIL